MAGAADELGVSVVWAGVVVSTGAVSVASMSSFASVWCQRPVPRIWRVGVSTKAPNKEKARIALHSQHQHGLGLRSVVISRAPKALRRGGSYPQPSEIIKSVLHEFRLQRGDGIQDALSRSVQRRLIDQHGLGRRHVGHGLRQISNGSGEVSSGHLESLHKFFKLVDTMLQVLKFFRLRMALSFLWRLLFHFGTPSRNAIYAKATASTIAVRIVSHT